MYLGRTRLKERGLTTSLSGVHNMTQITYRGQQYNAETYKAKVLSEQTQTRNHDLMYRGVKVERKYAVASR